ncbi:DUF559 domain-containing protein [Rhizobium sp. N324]|uniref:DUF559 domain-containing protein n=1 Tax=Rhizobium sp. N324 TaxID=1703969 RepID=UPI0007EA5A0C
MGQSLLQNGLSRRGKVTTIVRKNPEFWLSKINRNRERDVETREVLAQFGWTVLRFWEHQVADDIVDAIVSTVTHARGF